MSESDFNLYLKQVLEKTKDWKIKAKRIDFTDDKKKDTLQSHIEQLEKKVIALYNQSKVDSAIPDAYKKIEKQLEEIKEAFRGR